MSLIKCKECGKEISESAYSCPHCGYVYKKIKQMTVKKVVGIIFVFDFVSIALLYGIVFLFFDIIPSIKSKNEMAKYYGEWELVDGEYENALKNSDVEYKLKQQININKDNIENQGGNDGCGFNRPSKEYAITNAMNHCSKSYYLFTTIYELAEKSQNDSRLKNVMICFKLSDNTLTQTKCALNDNSTAKDVKIVYKLKSK